ncbi:hypothetical protein L1887_03766 [Cichorium endivia]|nr:hypothetical protein L1887_03766 [Cichorium endivia]
MYRAPSLLAPPSFSSLLKRLIDLELAIQDGYSTVHGPRPTVYDPSRFFHSILIRSGSSNPGPIVISNSLCFHSRVSD